MDPFSFLKRRILLIINTSFFHFHSFKTSLVSRCSNDIVRGTVERKRNVKERRRRAMTIIDRGIKYIYIYILEVGAHPEERRPSPYTAIHGRVLDIILELWANWLVTKP